MTNILTPEKYEEISNLCNRYNIKNWSINEKGEVDVNGVVDLRKRSLKNLPLKFGKVTGNFYCNYNQLTSLVGAPQEVGRSFYCEDNQLTSLEGAPQKVGGNFSCDDNQLTSLEGAPQEVDGGFFCSYNLLTSLEGAPQEVRRYFSCTNNQLTSLIGAPRKVGWNFYCDDNQLTSLEGAPQEVGGIFYCDNNKLTSLVGAPQEVGGSFYCGNNPISEYCPFFKHYYQADIDLKKCIENGVIADYTELLKMMPIEGDFDQERANKLTKTYRILIRKIVHMTKLAIKY